MEDRLHLPIHLDKDENSFKTSILYRREYQSSGITFECSCDGKGNLEMKLTMEDKAFSSLTDIDSMADGMQLFPEWLRLQAYVAGSIAASQLKIEKEGKKKKKAKK
ncbi:MAG: hypothetical protein IKS61_03260 [Aeriscardovia sp.]|nr:hypothetical protein [Aeriscardovia sp.]